MNKITKYINAHKITLKFKIKSDIGNIDIYDIGEF